MNQFEIWWASLPLPAGRRPVLLLSRNPAYSQLNKVLVAEITTTIRGIAIEVPLSRQEGLPVPCVANLDNIRTIEKYRLTERIGALSAGRHRVVKRALGHTLNWDELSSL